MDRVKQRHIDGGLALFDWTATAERELQEEIGPGGKERLDAAEARRVAARCVKTCSGWRVPILVVAVNGDAAHAEGTVFRPNQEYRAGEWVPLANVFARCAKGGDLSVMCEDEWLALFHAAKTASAPAAAAANTSGAPAAVTACDPSCWVFEDGCNEVDKAMWAATISEGDWEVVGSQRARGGALPADSGARGAALRWRHCERTWRQPRRWCGTAWRKGTNQRYCKFSKETASSSFVSPPPTALNQQCSSPEYV